MARFLHTLWPFGTHLTPHMAVACALREQGHDVALYTAPRLEPVAREAGLRIFPFRQLDQDRADLLVRAILAERRRPRRMWKKWREFLLDTIPAQLTDLEAVVAEWPPDVIVCDLAMLGPILVLGEAKRIPVAVLSHIGFSILRGREGYYPGMGQSRAKTIWDRLAAWLKWEIVELATGDIPGQINRIRSSYGLPPTRMRIVESLGSVPLFLIPTAPEFDHSRRDHPPSVHYVGPCLWPAPTGSPAWRQPLGNRPPRVLVEEGSLYAAEPTLLRAAAAGLANLPLQVTVMAGKGRRLSELALTGLPDNISVREWQPLTCLPGPVDVLVTSGNTESVTVALSRGVPVVVVPSILDQSEIARRVCDGKAGVRLPEARCSPHRLRAAVERVLSDPSYRANAERLERIFARYSGPHRAAEFLVALAGGRQFLPE